MNAVDIGPRNAEDCDMDILQALLSDENINAMFRAAMSAQELAGQRAKVEYLERCAADGGRVDPIMLDRVYWKAFEAAAPKRQLML